MLELIREHETLFAKIPPSIAARPPGGARASPSALRQPHLHPSPCLRQLSLPLIAERCREPGQSTSDPQNPRYQRQNFTMQTSHRLTQMLSCCFQVSTETGRSWATQPPRYHKEVSRGWTTITDTRKTQGQHSHRGTVDKVMKHTDG